MTYFEVLATYIAPPLLIFWLITRRDARQGKPIAAAGLLGNRAYVVVFGHVLIALLYTTPWDNYLVATGVWSYSEGQVTGITIGYVPIEEYTFFILQPIMTGFMLLTLSRYAFPADPKPLNSPRLRAASTLIIGVFWLAALAILLAGWEPGTYLGLILVWALPPIMLQLFFGADILWVRFKLVFTAILLSTTYLNFVDALAIRDKTWIISERQTVGLETGGLLPIEETLFFWITNVLVVLGITLMLAKESQPRAVALLKYLRASADKTPHVAIDQPS